MSPASNPIRSEPAFSPAQGQSDLFKLAHDLVEKVGVDGAASYCRGLGWGGVLAQVELLRGTH
ncbi:hypothetical protein [Pelagibius marinus]|uniref:hypothetical protein n=1 Tax=Pelagibius marinus TaxID=2762760 RepID=UPI0018726ED0|nr:hypothetical protein [Pelagibius marinus]